MTWQHTNRALSSGNPADAVPITFSNTPAIDAFGRLRVSNPYTLFDSKQLYDDTSIANNAENYPLWFDNQETSGGGTATLYNPTRSSTTLSVSDTTAGTRVRQSLQRFDYQPGKSQMLFTTFNLHNAGNTGITKRVGLFDGNNGLFFQIANDTLSFVIRNNANDQIITQENWNVDSLDGTGPSGINIDFTKVQILFIDFEWLGSGRVRFGFMFGGLIYYAHYQYHANVIGAVYMQTPNLPIRVEISNDGTGPVDTLETICHTVMSEGGVQATGITRTADPVTVAANVINANTIGTAYAVAGIRLKSSHIGTRVIVEHVGIEVTANDVSHWALCLNPTLSGAITYSDIVNSAVQYSFCPTTNPGVSLTDRGEVLFMSSISGRAEVSTQVVNALHHLGSKIDGTRDEMILCFIPGAINLDVTGWITWSET